MSEVFVSDYSKWNLKYSKYISKIVRTWNKIFNLYFIIKRILLIRGKAILGPNKVHNLSLGAHLKKITK